MRKRSILVRNKYLTGSLILSVTFDVVMLRGGGGGRGGGAWL